MSFITLVHWCNSKSTYKTAKTLRFTGRFFNMMRACVKLANVCKSMQLYAFVGNDNVNVNVNVNVNSNSNSNVNVNSNDNDNSDYNVCVNVNDDAVC